VSGWAARSAFGGGSGCGGRTHNGRARTIGQLCCSIARKRVRYLVRRTVGERPGREAGLRYSAGRALRGCGRSIDQGAVRRHALERGPAALADRAEARGFGRRASAKQARGLRDLRRRLILLADRRTADADSNSNNQPNKQTYPVAAGKPARGTPKAEDLRDFWGEEVCLRVVPTVGIAVSTPVGIFLGCVGIPVGTHVGTPVGTRRGIHAARNRLTRSSTSDCDRPKRLRLISISRRASCRRARGAS
jgi:hypothetical protein